MTAWPQVLCSQVLALHPPPPRCTHLHLQHRWDGEGRERLPAETANGERPVGLARTSVTSEKRQADWRQGGDAGMDGGRGGSAESRAGGVRVERRRETETSGERRTEMDGGRATPV